MAPIPEERNGQATRPYQEEPDTGLKLLGHRYYDSSTGRFLTRDPSGDGRNWYGYCLNQPISSIDAEGLKRKLIILIGNLGKGTKSDQDLRGTKLNKKILELKEAYSEEYDVEIRTVRSRGEVEKALEEADAAILFGHSYVPGDARGGMFEAADHSELTNGGLVRIARVRKSKGKGKLDFIRIYSCETLENDVSFQLWCNLTDNLFGYMGKCYFGGSSDMNEGGKWWIKPWGTRGGARLADKF